MRLTNLVQGTPEWKLWRQKGGYDNPYRYAIGASDAPIIMGTSPYKTAEELWLEKLGLRIPEHTRIMDEGTEAEPVIRDWYIGQSNIIFEPVCGTDDEFPWMNWSADGLDELMVEGLECKLTGRESYVEVMEGLCPAKWYPQIQHACRVGGLRNVHLVVQDKLSKAFAYTIVKRDVLYIEKLVKAELQFMEFLNSGTRPPFYADARLRVAPGDSIVPADAFIRPQNSNTLPELVEVGIAPQWFKQLALWNEKATSLSEITSSNADTAGRLLNEITTFEKDLVAQAMKAKSPYQVSIDAIQKAVATALTTLLAAKALLANKLGTYLQAERTRQRELDNAKASVVAQGVSPESLIDTEEVKASGAALTHTVKFEVANPEIVPRDFCSPDSKKINKLKKEVDPETWGATPREIRPGIVCWVESKARSTGKDTR